MAARLLQFPIARTRIQDLGRHGQIHFLKIMPNMDLGFQRVSMHSATGLKTSCAAQSATEPPKRKGRHFRHGLTIKITVRLRPKYQKKYWKPFREAAVIMPKR